MSFLSTLGGALTGFVTGGPIGAIVGGAAGAGLIGKHGGGAPVGAIPKKFVGGPSSYPVVPTPGVGGAIQRILPGGKTGYQVQAGANGAGGPPKGMRLNKSGYFLKDGTYIAPGTKYVKIRRRNSMNPRALSRAMARVEGAKTIQHKLSQWTTPKYTGGGKKKACA